MGLCCLLGKEIFHRAVQTKVKQRRRRHITWIQPVTPKQVFSTTNTLLIDAIQMFYESLDTIDISKEEIIKYSSMKELIDSGDDIGDLTKNRKTGAITNRVYTFSLDEIVIAIGKNLFTLVDNWKEAAARYDAEDRIEHVFLCMDGTGVSPKHRRRKKNSLISDVREVVPGSMYRGSLERFMRRRKHQLEVLDSLTTLMQQSSNITSHVPSFYLVTGTLQDKEKKYDLCFKIGGKYTHPHFRNLKSQHISYLEADSIIPMVWSTIQDGKNRACVITKDSDMIITLLALADPRLLLASEVTGTCDIDFLETLDNTVVFRAGEAVSMQKQHQLEMLLHLTMGGNDYVEAFPTIDSEAILCGIDVMRQHQPRRRFFSCVSFITWNEVKAVLDANNVERDDYSRCAKFHYTDLMENGIHRLVLTSITLNCQYIYPIRLSRYIYLVAYDPEDTTDCYDWYAKRCSEHSNQTASSFEQKLLENVSMREAFKESMKRRFYSLSLVTDTRPDDEWISLLHKDMATKYGYTETHDYVKRMTL